MASSLKRDYISVNNGASASYGGSQMWLDSYTLQKGGCGIIAAADLLLYLQHKEIDSVERYKHYIEWVRKYFLMFGPLGVNGAALAAGLNALMRKKKLPYHASWGVMPSKLRSTVEEMLARDIPVIFSIGPDFPAVFIARKIDIFFKDSCGNMARAGYARRHFMMMTALTDGWIRLSSWGREYYMKWQDFEEMAGKYSCILSSICKIVPRR